jgi:alkyl sulfatase BDS1-like metallo-beta-lactamase superfamily hydrolase
MNRPLRAPASSAVERASYPLARLLTAFLLAFAVACGKGAAPPADTGVASPDLAAHSAEFRREVIEVTDGVWVAVGFGLANSILLEGDDGVVIVDTMESAKAARAVKREFDEITDKPVKAVIYTHNHADHVFGTRVFAGDDAPDVYSHASTLVYLDRVVNVLRPILFRRSMRQFGNYLPDEARVNCGIGPKLEFDRETRPDLVRPNKTFDGERLEVTIAGIDMVLVHAPGETPDQIFVWLPKKRVLLSGDNFYKSFPNLYAIRGTAYRDVMDWVRSLDKMRDLRPAYLVPSHTRPLQGADDIASALTDYRDAIQFVHDQTVRNMNAGLTPDAIVERVHLPKHLASKPYLQEFYGRVDWSVRSIFSGYLGWFDGNATGLAPLSSVERARRMSTLAGGVEALRARARDAFDTGDQVWALELSDALLSLDEHDEAARGLRAGSLRALAEQQISANARNYYLTQALEAEGAVEIVAQDPSQATEAMLRSFPIETVLAAMASNLDPVKSADTDTVVALHFTDVDETYLLHVRHGVAEIRRAVPEDPDIEVTTDSYVWKQILVGQRNAAAALALGKLSVDGGVIELAKILLMFRPG